MIEIPDCCELRTEMNVAAAVELRANLPLFHRPIAQETCGCWIVQSEPDGGALYRNSTGCPEHDCDCIWRAPPREDGDGGALIPYSKCERIYWCEQHAAELVNSN